MRQKRDVFVYVVDPGINEKTRKLTTAYRPKGSSRTRWAWNPFAHFLDNEARS